MPTFFHYTDWRLPLVILVLYACTGGKEEIDQLPLTVRRRLVEGAPSALLGHVRIGAVHRKQSAQMFGYWRPYAAHSPS